MAFAQGSRSGLSYVAESTFGTTPGSPAMIDVPFVTHSLNLSKQPLESNTIRSDRNIEVFRHGNKQTSGDISVEFRADDYDWLLEGLMFNAFSSSVLKNGTTLKHYTIEDRAEDIAKYRAFTGMRVNTAQFSIAPNQMVTAQFGLVGKGMTTSSSPLDASITAASSNQPFDSFTAVLEEGGTDIAIVSAIDFTVENGLAPTFVVGSAETPQHEYGRCRITGNISCYFEDFTFYNKFVNETISSLSITLADPDGVSGNDYTFYFPRVKYNGGDVPVANEQSRIISVPFVALYDSSTECELRITKS